MRIDHGFASWEEAILGGPKLSKSGQIIAFVHSPEGVLAIVDVGHNIRRLQAVPIVDITFSR
jgi:hypothetical protein